MQAFSKAFSLWRIAGLFFALENDFFRCYNFFRCSSKCCVRKARRANQGQRNQSLERSLQQGQCVGSAGSSGAARIGWGAYSCVASSSVDGRLGRAVTTSRLFADSGLAEVNLVNKEFFNGVEQRYTSSDSGMGYLVDRLYPSCRPRPGSPCEVMPCGGFEAQVVGDEASQVLFGRL